MSLTIVHVFDSIKYETMSMSLIGSMKLLSLIGSAGVSCQHYTRPGPVVPHLVSNLIISLSDHRGPLGADLAPLAGHRWTVDTDTPSDSPGLAADLGNTL